MSLGKQEFTELESANNINRDFPTFEGGESRHLQQLCNFQSGEQKWKRPCDDYKDVDKVQTLTAQSNSFIFCIIHLKTLNIFQQWIASGLSKNFPEMGKVYVSLLLLTPLYVKPAKKKKRFMNEPIVMSQRAPLPTQGACSVFWVHLEATLLFSPLNHQVRQGFSFRGQPQLKVWAADLLRNYSWILGSSNRSPNVRPWDISWCVHQHMAKPHWWADWIIATHFPFFIRAGLEYFHSSSKCTHTHMHTVSKRKGFCLFVISILS